MKKLILLLFLLSLSFSSCEKDDICDEATSTTPKLIIEFYDALHPTVLKNVANLKVKEAGLTTFFAFDAVSKIELPLKTAEDITKYSLVNNSSDTTLDNEDFLQFNYARENQFVSRACGFKTIFTLDSTTPYIKSDASVPDGIWMQTITVNTSNIATENETHIKIYF
ncbi:MAG: hypothetical protein RL308_1596 [Bacteroidota bacterium]|jgi:hypothetical protein